jgi:hypothetical protein
LWYAGYGRASRDPPVRPGEATFMIPDRNVRI